MWERLVEALERAAGGPTGSILTPLATHRKIPARQAAWFHYGVTTMWRVIVRISYFRDTGSGLRNHHVVPLFTALGLQNTATGTFESPAVDRNQAANLLSQVLHAIADPQQFNDVDPQVALKHLWVYIDRV